MSGVFTKVDSFITSTLSDVTKIIETQISSSVSTILLASVSLYICVYGYMVLAAKVQSPVYDLLWKLVSLAIIAAFIKNSGGY
ncbi:hypothetical protein BKG91_02375 [Rodentibacter caecimuris]|uniref:Conjugal transfer protein TrbL n=1 Tax=Rodentibacter caecimuris TaxID=1796644 RepID=A0AAJ3K659_9PAST|nr:type IV secretion system protein [Rodentibacter heylii]OOF73189.1 hypothetical protein BKG90_01750 [Rodentibacter heylii]OOF75308.1 hypothetical protein BKG99_08365 [Rodentibacter heylii]OOF75801.1 hypothetical protein BKG91_02375 [Rodentibacter heylii]